MVYDQQAIAQDAAYRQSQQLWAAHAEAVLMGSMGMAGSIRQGA